MDDLLNGYTQTPIYVGQSGARVFIVGEDRVLKTAESSEIGPERFDACVREIRMYRFFKEIGAEYAPEALFANFTDKKTELLLPFGESISKEEVTPSFLEVMLEKLVCIHQSETPAFLEAPQGLEPFSEETISLCVEGWNSVLEEHSGSFDENAIAQIGAQINEIIHQNSEMKNCLIHGDFHRENLLRMKDGRVVVCDWQGACIGDPAGDISFFCSRLGSEGFSLSIEELIQKYCAVSRRLGYEENADRMIRAAHCSNLLTSFRFWHDYLHDSTKERVAGIYEKMIESFRVVLKGQDI